jgi:signal transduction histidine kinase
VISLQGRLGIWLIGSVVLLFGLHWVVTSRAPRHLTEKYIATRLEHDAENLLVGLRFDTDGVPDLDSAYITPVYQRAFSGHYFIILANGHRLRSRSLWDEDLDTPQSMGEEPMQTHVTGPMGQRLLLWTASYVKYGHPVVISVGEDLSELDARIAGFRLRFALVTLAILASLIIIQRVILRWGLRPLDRVRRECRRLERGEIMQLNEELPMEIKPLEEEVNRVLRLMQQRLERSRNALGNLAHALKTPLALLSQLNARNAERLGPQDEAEYRSSVETLRTIVDRELKRARLAGTGSPGKPLELGEELSHLLEVLKKIYAEKGLRYECVIHGNARISGDREDILELFGNLLDNASKWARSAVRVTLTGNPDGLSIDIEDDGPGIEDPELAQLIRRGVRLDESTPGHGLGLSIANEIVDHYGGEIRFSRSSELGGLKVALRLPHAGHS